MILKQLQMDDINIQDCRGQAFDNAAVMAGHRSGVQARITEVNPKIVFVPCTNHSLNLAASVGADSVTFLGGTLDRLFSFFSASTHRWDILIEITGATIKRAGETRWSSRADAVKVVHAKFTETIAALERLMDGSTPSKVPRPHFARDCFVVFKVESHFESVLGYSPRQRHRGHYHGSRLTASFVLGYISDVALDLQKDELVMAKTSSINISSARSITDYLRRNHTNIDMEHLKNGISETNYQSSTKVNVIELSSTHLKLLVLS
ncbi:uncharacterized protein LOC115220743 [Octopus sinensis]|uniref:Uncharacterized protein LOC115220743 n=1 Tax=Octopus sinensis TaxID=2607531 RepID=A0A6P7T945_9MOLL|nr:uncharacterized protein LOC115220743 [Octopus sinensis]